jgi:histidinol-phosphatase
VPDTEALRADLAVALELADLAADVAMEVYGRDFEVHRKPDLSPVTEADVRIEQLIRRELAGRRPGDAVLGEEGGLGGPAGADRTWVVDPIDGTKNFAAGIQVWATLIALVIDGEPVVGVASAPALGERYDALYGGGARLNGEPITVSKVSNLEDALLCSGGTQAMVGTPWEKAYLDLTRHVYRTRGFGDFWGHALVARGSADAMIEAALRTWDWMAMRVIVQVAGGRMTQFEGTPVVDGGSVLTSNGALHEAFVERLTA